jgi:hypothetical protein
MQLTRKLSSKRNLLHGGSKSKKNKNNRKSPSESATSMTEGTIHHGNDGQLWVVKKAANGTPRWMPYISVELNGFKALTVDYLAKKIGKEIEIYERGYDSEWPKKGDSNLIKLRWIGNGNAQYFKQKTILENWLNTQKPVIKDNTMFSVLGIGDWYGNKDMSDMSLQVDSKNKKIVSSNIVNMEAFIKK